MTPNKRPPTALDTANSIIEAAAGGKSHDKIAKLMDTPLGADLYAVLDEARLDVAKENSRTATLTKSAASQSLDALAESARAPGESKWTAMNRVLQTKLGKALYRLREESL